MTPTTFIPDCTIYDALAPGALAILEALGDVFTGADDATAAAFIDAAFEADARATARRVPHPRTAA